MSFEFHLPSLEEMRSSPEGLEMLRMIDDDNFRSAIISGCPGSGKTTVSIYRLVRLVNQQVKVHLVTYQNLLVHAIRSLTQGHRVPNNCVSTFHKWYCPLVNSNFDTNDPPSAEQMIMDLQHSSLVQSGLQEILVDEGQDLPQSVYLAIPRFTKRFFVGADDGQQVHPKHGAPTGQIEQSLREHCEPFSRFILGRNFRNTYETYRFARQFMPQTNHVAWDETTLDRLLHEKRRGPKPVIITYRNLSSRNEHLQTTLNNAKGNVAVLCPMGKKGSASGESVEEIHDLIRKMGISATKYYSGLSKELENFKELEKCVVTTFKSAKGLEFDTVIIPRINYFQKIPEEWYVACTRARGQLFIYRNIEVPYYDPVSQFKPDTFDQVSLDEKPTNGDLIPF